LTDFVSKSASCNYFVVRAKSATRRQVEGWLARRQEVDRQVGSGRQAGRQEVKLQK